MNKANVIIGMIFLIAILISVAFVFCSAYERVTVTETRYISMKWIEEQILDTDYYFEFDNTTSYMIDGNFDNPSYTYHKYNIGDKITLTDSYWALR